MKILLVSFIRFYMKYISPNKKPCCRFVPTCSDYSLQAIEEYGALKGSIIAIKRIVRCNPFSKKSGYDPLK